MKALIKILLIIIAYIIMIICISCIEDPNMVYNTNTWVVKKVNDTVLVVIPKNSEHNYPYLMNIKTSVNSKFNQ